MVKINENCNHWGFLKAYQPVLDQHPPSKNFFKTNKLPFLKWTIIEKLLPNPQVYVTFIKVAK